MKKYILPIVVISILVAIPVLGATSTVIFPNPLGATSDITTLVKNILNFLWKLAWAIAPILIVYAGFLYITSAGNEDKVKTAQKTLIWALVGFAVVLIASSVPAIIQDFLSGDGTETQEETENNDSDISPIGEFPDEFYNDVLQYSD